MKYSKYVSKEIRGLSHLIKRAFDNSEAKTQLDDMTGTHGWVIGYLLGNRGKDIYQRDIEKAFSIRRSTVTCMLQLMEKNGFIERVAVEKDARLKKIVLTEKSYEIERILDENNERMENTIVEGISNEDMKIFFSVTEKMQQNLMKNEVKGDSK